MTRVIGRRSFLVGMGGVALGLPLLRSLLPASVRAQDQTAPKRFAVLWENNGVNYNKFWPATPYGPLTAESFRSGRAIDPLAAYRDKITIPRGMNMVGNGGHLGVLALTATRALPHSGLDEMRVAWAQGISVERAIAQRINPGGAAPLTLRTNDRSGSVVYDSVSYTGPNEIVYGERSPWVAYRDLIGLAGEGSNEAIDLLVRRRRSVLDLVEGRLELLGRAQLGQADRRKLEMHFESVRDLERRLERSGMMCVFPPDRLAEVQGIGSPSNYPRSIFGQVGRMHLDIIALAFACDLNRVATMFFGRESGGPIYDFDGLNHIYPHHPLSHGTRGESGDSGSVPDYLERLYEIDRWHAEQMRYLLDRLSSYDEETGSLLDHCCIVWMNSMTDGNAHHSRDMPVVIAGSAGGYLRTGSYLDVREGNQNIPHNMLLTTVVNAMGIAENHFGSPSLGRSGPIAALLR